MTEIADFLRARIAERRALAEAASPGPWHSDGGSVYATHPTGEVVSYTESADHIAANDPVDVLADCDAKLALIDEIEPPTDGTLAPATDAELHALESHPAWEYRTTSGIRKQWDDIDVPPHDDMGNPEPGWERNVDAGRDGWERFDYTEESYWRRLRPDGPLKPRIPRALRILAQPFTGHPDHKGEEWTP